MDRTLLRVGRGRHRQAEAVPNLAGPGGLSLRLILRGGFSSVDGLLGFVRAYGFEAIAVGQSGFELV